MTRGFTLIETVIYIALLAIIMGGAVAAAYALSQGSASLSAAGVIEGEGNFVLRKIDWALTGTSSLAIILAPAVGTYGAALSLKRVDGTQVDFRLNGSSIEMREGGATGIYEPITTENVSVSALQFYAIPASGKGPGGVEASTTINTETFTTTRYARK